MRYTISAVLVALMVTTSANAQSGGGGGGGGGGGAGGGGSAGTAGTGGSSAPATAGHSGSTTGVAPAASRPGGPETNANSPTVIINERLRANSGNDLNPPRQPGLVPGTTTTVGLGSGGTARQTGVRNARSCRTADCASPLQGRYMALVDSMVRIAGVHRSR